MAADLNRRHTRRIAPIETQPMHVLVVVQSSDTRALLVRQLQRAGYDRVATANSAEEALERLSVGRESGDEVDLILMDVVLPGMSGIDACCAIRSEPYFHDLPILIATGILEVDDITAAFAAGATDHIPKPCSLAVLVARVGTALRLKHETERREAGERELRETTSKFEKANAALHRLSLLDGLTAIPNRRSFDETFDREWRWATTTGGTLSLMILDLDHFKRHNDTFGHAAGDECLKSVAAVFAQVLKRQSDFAARYGGEEFALILPETEIEGARHVAEAIRESIAELEFVYRGHPDIIRVTASIGLAAARPAWGGSTVELLDAADQALYAAKAAGRNIVAVSNYNRARLPTTDQAPNTMDDAVLGTRSGQLVPEIA